MVDGAGLPPSWLVQVGRKGCLGPPRAAISSLFHRRPAEQPPSVAIIPFFLAAMSATLQYCILKYLKGGGTEDVDFEHENTDVIV
jgi:hypothetical protein